MAFDTYINGSQPSFVNVSADFSDFFVGGQQFSGSAYAPRRGAFKSINYSAKQDPGQVQGNMVSIVGRTAGYGTADGSFEMLLGDFNDIAYAMTGNGQFPLMSVDFLLTVQYSINGVDVFTDVLQGVRITSVENNNQQGSDATTVQCNISIAQLTKNGISMFGFINDLK